MYNDNDEILMTIGGGRQHIHHGWVQRARVHVHGGDVRRAGQRVDADTADELAAQRRVVRHVPRAPVRDRRLRRAGPHERRRALRPGHQPVDARGGHVQPAQQLRRGRAGRHDIRGRRLQRPHHRGPGGVLQRPHRRVVRTRERAVRAATR